MALGLLFSFLGVPAAWILAGILGAGSVALVTQDDLPVNEHLFTFARGTVGVVAGAAAGGDEPAALSTAGRGVADAGDRARRGRGHPLRQPQPVKLLER